MTWLKPELAQFVQVPAIEYKRCIDSASLAMHRVLNAATQKTVPSNRARVFTHGITQVFAEV
jgi:hypothetical protein